MATTYSSFFASGLLAPPVTIYSSKDYHLRLDDKDMVDAFPKPGGLSPAAPSSPIDVLDDTDIETVYDADSQATTPTLESRSCSGTLNSNSTRHGTGTMTLPNSDVAFDTFNANGMATTGAGSINAAAQAQISTSAGVHIGIRGPSQNQAEDCNQSVPRSPSQPNGRRTRKRKSSLAGATSPMSAIKSPSRSVGHALEIHRHLLASPLRSRSGSVSLATAAADVMAGCGDEMSLDQFNFLGRLRSGSNSAFRKRHLRRASMHPPAPPPVVPLPALPPSLADTPTCGFFDPSSRSAPFTLGSRMPLAQNSASCPNPDDISPGMYMKIRDRSYSINAYDCINEEMKEN